LAQAGFEDRHQKSFNLTTHYIPRSTKTNAMRSISIIALLALVVHAHADETAANDLDESQNQELVANDEEDSQNEEIGENESMDQFADLLTDKLADKLFDVALIGNDEDDQLDEDELGEVEDYAHDGEIDDDQLDEDELASVLGLRGGAAMKAMKAMAAMKAMKAMKAMAAMKAMKKSTAMAAMKAMKVSKIAKGKFKNALVFRGTKAKTSSGLTKGDLIKNANGKIVSKKQSAAAKKRFGSTIKKWTDAVKAARKSLGLKGFVAVKKGTPLYTKAKANYR